MDKKIIFVFLIQLLKTQLLNFEDLSLSDENLFQKFKQKYHKEYISETELQYRFEIFQKNLRIFKSEPDFEDSDGQILLGSSLESEKTYTLGINQFADMTEEEFENSYLIPTNLLYKILPAEGIAPIFNLIFPKNKEEKDKQDKSILKGFFGGFSKIFGRRLQQNQIPNDIKRQLDWEQLGKVSPIKNQKRCNSCYAFAATGALESMFSIKYDSDFIALSTQEILDCDTVNKGCKGGQPSLVFDYVSKNGLSLEKDYEYVAKDETCKLGGRRLQFYYGNQTQNQYQPYNQQIYGYNGRQNYNQYGYNNGYKNPYNVQNNTYGQIQQTSTWPQYSNNQYQPQQQYQNYQNQNYNQYGNTNQTVFNNQNNNYTQTNQNDNYNQTNQNNNYTQNTQQNIVNQNNQQSTDTQQKQNQQKSEQDIRDEMTSELEDKQEQELKNLKKQYEIQREEDRNLIQEEQDQILNLIENKKSAIEEKEQQIKTIKQKQKQKTILDFVAEELLSFDEQFISETQKSIDKLQKEIEVLKDNLIKKVEETEQKQIKLYEQKKQEILQKHRKELEDLEVQIQEELKNHKEQKQSQAPQFERFDFLQTYKSIAQNVIALLQALQDGPVVVAHHVSSQMKFYAKGVFSGDGCEDKPVNHASLIVGYNLDDKDPYFRLKNAWGTKWGEDGYYKIAIGEIGYDQKGLCSIAGTPFNVQPVLKQLNF